MDKLIIIKTTVKNKIIKNNIINELIINDYVSCINVIENVSSHYKWQGKVESEREDILFIKTMKRNEKLVYEVIRAIHDYETPEIITIDVNNVDSSYLNWTNESVIKKKAKQLARSRSRSRGPEPPDQLTGEFDDIVASAMVTCKVPFLSYNIYTPPCRDEVPELDFYPSECFDDFHVDDLDDYCFVGEVPWC